MWKHPRYAELTGKPDAAEPPTPTGELLATFPRKGPDGIAQELRVVLDEYQEHPYISVRLWTRSRSGGLWPCKGKGISIRLSEAAGVAEALRQALELAEPPPPREAPPRRRERPGGRRQWDSDGSPPRPAGATDDEDPGY